MQRHRSYSTEAIVLKRTDLGEADRILTLFTPSKGKFHAVAKGIRRPISKMAGHVELLSHSQLHIAIGRNLDIVTQAQCHDLFLHVRNNLWHMTCGFYLAELTDRFIEDRTQHTDVYQLLLGTLRRLDASVSGSPTEQEKDVVGIQYSRIHLLIRYFEIHLLTAIGYEPAFRHCAQCAKELQPEESGFSPSLGGALCPQCSRYWVYPLSLNALKVLRLLQRSQWKDVPRLRLELPLYAEIEQAMHSLLLFHLERDMKSWSFLDMLRLSPNEKV